MMIKKIISEMKHPQKVEEAGPEYKNLITGKWNE